MSAPLAIHARGLHKRFRGGRVTALAGLDLAVEAGEVVAVTGASGSGKSTLLHLLAGLMPRDAGEVAIFGLRPQGRAAWTSLRQTQIGLIFQEDFLMPGLTAQQNVELPMLVTGVRRQARVHRAGALLERVNAAGLADRRPEEMSGGERQRVAVARGLANAPRLLLADEPTGELDSANSAGIVGLLLELQRSEGLSVLMITHDSAVADACGRKMVLSDGRMVTDGEASP